ncbi:MAG: response regulator [Nitrosopumilaceae archaeon]|nr:response regulator [Nitrosopumilaceae archaeon]NIU02339.1 response regulator [Nitrosopumilaceae archaeon]NIU88794.1 response regulator [Nitrosopumilaceae archaeon]NIV66921.1 response regulator [Nitrosopumilaceae archaeon]NIX62940.1 response regulator [Nitrosopumilaceae archaeon]
MIIDDNPDITEMITKYLKMSGHSCEFANDGRNGLNMIKSKKYDVVLLDLAMPGFSGTDVIDVLVKEGTIREQKVVIFTASSKPNEELDELTQKGVHSCLKKPIDPDSLVLYLESLNEKRKETYHQS